MVIICSLYIVCLALSPKEVCQQDCRKKWYIVMVQSIVFLFWLLLEFHNFWIEMALVLLEFSDSATGEEWLCLLFFFFVWHIELELYKVPRIFVHVDYGKLKEDYSASLTNLFFSSCIIRSVTGLLKVVLPNLCSFSFKLNFNSFNIKQSSILVAILAFQLLCLE